ncbi:malto-oligosyltrehalose trehalohydrolase [Jiella sp. MQZ9-1]|uniref:Malto-oligosyltrehalose trehalohydrolase n=1 Tax=Jiella flava TaxID=2816857 RepID=A0A939FSV5_9HYPH|nr:malto-oligosyltrehalose trehalohydrolase [Jiella flava]MBO0661298.1 malto-oligosyltrehalose trehalohydrolase [Jiella flava]MCD2469943.1 malto-oligosyltrehalose trehalohydrolase [Jiella flava]
MARSADRFAYDTSWGPRFVDGRTEFRLWAPSAPQIDLAIGDTAGKASEFWPMERDDEGWWRATTDRVKPGEAYGFRLDSGLIVPDPASRRQFGDVHGLSLLVDPKAYTWQSADWTGRPWEETVFYELHTGTFTPDGSFAGIEEKLDYLKETGITAIELLPVAQFGGRRGWGYDGVLLYCPHEAYGGAEGLKRLIDAAHQRGLMVFLDVVYNHFGPDGNYLGAYAPEFFHEEIHTPWGAAIAYDAQPVRDFMIDNALYWLEEYRIDGLRLDAIDSIEDTTDTPLVKELAARVRAHFPDRHVHITSEDDRNISWHIERDGGRPILVSGEWNDDFHHTAHVLATHEEEGYYADYSRRSVAQMAKALATGFVFQGEHSDYRGRNVGVSSAHLPPTAFVNFLQNHDQIGNRAFGDRLADLASRRVVECLQAILMLAPQIPLIFMGEEYGDTHPFCFFTDFDGELGEAVREGRRAEFKKFAAFHDEDARQLIPDPNAVSTFEASKLDWSMVTRPTYRRRLAIVRGLLEKRQRLIVPLLTGPLPEHGGEYHVSDETLAFVVAWHLRDGAVLHLFANLDDEPWAIPSNVVTGDLSCGDLLHAHPKGADEILRTRVLPGPSVVFRLESQKLIAGKGS